jgi:dihydroorotate dehydrogenase
MTQLDRARNVVYENVIRPAMFSMKPELAHEVVMTSLRRASLLPGLIKAGFGELGSTEQGKPAELFGLKFPNRVGLAAGFDKNAVALPAWEALGFGFAEAGTITALAQPGNPRPRVWRLPEQKALVNRMGFNNDGSDAVACRLKRLHKSSRRPSIPIGLNIGKSKLTPLEKAHEDYLYTFNRLYPYADYFAINVSSPNTPGLRDLQNRDALARLLSTLTAANQDKPTPKPLLLKMAPDLAEEGLLDLVHLAEEHGLDGLIATNTTIDHSSVEELPAYSANNMRGGLSGSPLRERATKILRLICAETKLPVIASGGIDSVDAVREKLDAGASLIQIYTGFIYKGPAFIKDICRELREAAE